MVAWMVSFRWWTIHSTMWSCWQDPTVEMTTPIAFMSLVSAAIPRSLSLVKRVILIPWDPIVPNILLILCLRIGAVRFSTQATRTMLRGCVIETRNNCLFTNMSSQCMCCSTKSRWLFESRWLGNAGNGRARTVFRFRAAMLAPQIAVALFTPSRRMSELRNAPAFKAEIIFTSGGNPRLACSLRALKLRATSRLEYAA